MGNLKKHFDKGYTVLPNELVGRNDISMTAKGLFWFFCSRPDDWNFSIEGTSALIKEGKDAIRSGVQELEKYGYLVRVQSTSSDGRFSGAEYHLYSTPIDHEPLAENPPLENPRQLNKDLLNDISSLHSDISKGLTKKEENISTLHSDIFPKKKSNRFVKPTLEEVAAYCKERRNSIDPEAFVAYYESKGWMVGKSPMKDWKHAVITFEINQKKQKNSGSGSNNGNNLDPNREWRW